VVRQQMLLLLLELKLLEGDVTQMERSQQMAVLMKLTAVQDLTIAMLRN
tara:strand:- start:669 stop:815 length:147 start_codon:yes stop_codon:yes gene_type:complete